MDDLRSALTAAQPAAAERLRGADLRATRQRVAVLEWLDANPGHHAAESLVDGTGLSKATVYHVLGQLGDAALVLTAESGAGRMLFESTTEPHHHFVCRSCDRIIDTPCVPGDAPCLTVDLPGVAIEQADVILRGRCAACA